MYIYEEAKQNGSHHILARNLILCQYFALKYMIPANGEEGKGYGYLFSTLFFIL